jgi:DNA-binding transcriptional LysR family regulator
MAIELHRPRHLLGLARLGSVGRAGAALRMTQPALSRSVKILEEEVGAALRSGGGFAINS